MRSYSAKEVLRILQADGWYIVNIEGSHHQLKHPTKPGKLTVKHPAKDFKTKTLKSIFEKAGLEI